MRRLGMLVLAIAVVGYPRMIFAQGQAIQAAAVGAATTEMDANAVRLLVGRSTVVNVGSPIARVSLTSPDVADAMVTTQNQLLVNGKLPGTISMFVWDRGGALRRYEVTVQRDLASLDAQVRQLFPGENIHVQSTGKNVVLSGTVRSKDILEKAVNVAAGYVDKKEEVVSLLELQPGGASNQVLLRVRFAEVSRNAMMKLGANYYTDGYKKSIGRVTTGQFPAPTSFDQQGAMVGQTQVFSDFLNLFLFSYKDQLGAAIKALQTKGLFQSLAEPNLVAESGKEASFLAGGEFPVPVVQGTGGAMSVSISFKEFGVRLSFTPVVNGDRVHLKVRPEVSTLDFNNAILLQGFRIPALSTRRTETEIELQDGQTFAIAGLLSNNVSSTLQKIPGIGDIPILGQLFRSKSAQKEQTELVVMITPQILRNDSPGVTPSLPKMPENFLPPLSEKQSRPLPAPAFRTSEQAIPGAVVASASPKNVPVPMTAPTLAAPSPAAAAAAVSALTPTAPKMAEAAPKAAASTVQSPAAKGPSAPNASMSKKDQKALERTLRAEQAQAKKIQRAEAEQSARQAKLDAERDRKAAKEHEKQERIDAEMAKRKAAADAKAAKQRAAEDKKASEAAKKQAAVHQERTKSLGDAAARLKQAEQAYNAELEKQNGQPTQSTAGTR
jgi:pilus assembly protein CpaC